MSSFLGHIKDIPDPRVAGMVTYPLDAILPAGPAREEAGPARGTPWSFWPANICRG